MKYIVFIICLLISCNAFANISLTDKEYENLQAISDALYAEFTDFNGFNGSRNSMEVVGIPEGTVKSFIKTMDLDKAKVEKEKPRKDITTKLKGLGFTDDEIKMLVN